MDGAAIVSIHPVWNRAAAAHVWHSSIHVQPVIIWVVVGWGYRQTRDLPSFLWLNEGHGDIAWGLKVAFTSAHLSWDLKEQFSFVWMGCKDRSREQADVQVKWSISSWIKHEKEKIRWTAKTYVIFFLWVKIFALDHLNQILIWELCMVFIMHTHTLVY